MDYFYLNLGQQVCKKLPLNDLPRVFDIVCDIVAKDDSVETFTLHDNKGNDVTPFCVHDNERFRGKTIHLTTTQTPLIPCSIVGKEMFIDSTTDFAVAMKHVEDSFLLLKLYEKEWKVGNESYQHASFGLRRFYIDHVDEDKLWSRYASSGGGVGELASILHEIRLLIPYSKVRYGPTLEARLVLFVREMPHRLTLEAAKRVKGIIMCIFCSEPDKGTIERLL